MNLSELLFTLILNTPSDPASTHPVADIASSFVLNSESVFKYSIVLIPLPFSSDASKVMSIVSLKNIPKVTLFKKVVNLFSLMFISPIGPTVSIFKVRVVTSDVFPAGSVCVIERLCSPSAKVGRVVCQFEASSTEVVCKIVSPSFIVTVHFASPLPEIAGVFTLLYDVAGLTIFVGGGGLVLSIFKFLISDSAKLPLLSVTLILKLCSPSKVTLKLSSSSAALTDVTPAGGLDAL